MDQTKDFVYIAGNSLQKTDLMKRLKVFVHNIIPVNITTNAHFLGIDTQSIPFELSALSLCEV